MKIVAGSSRLILTTVSVAGLALVFGCETSPRDVPPTQTPAASPVVYPLDTPKPMPSQTSEEPPPPAYNDPPLMDERLPEESWFVSAYNHVGRPRIAVFVNRTLDGELVASQGVPNQSTEVVRSSTGAVDVQHSQGSGYSNGYGGGGQHQSDSFKTSGPSQYTEHTTTYLQPGQYDEANLQSLDYTEMESRLSEWIGSGGQVTLLAPDFLRSHLSADQVKDIQAGKASGLAGLSQSIQADVLIQVQAHPIRRGDQVMVLLVGQAVNVRGGESLAQASVEMPTPVDRYQLNNFTRFLARKLIHGMVGSWSSTPPSAAPAPATQP